MSGTTSPDTDRQAALDSIEPDERRAALAALVQRGPGPGPAGSRHNMHVHSFFSFSSQMYSPSHIVWRARQEGLFAVGLCDFDVLDGLEEFLAAGTLCGVRTCVNLETRVYWADCADTEINSPGEPGISYLVGLGFVREPALDSEQAESLAALRALAERRNRALVDRINKACPEIAIDYADDVLPLTPNGNATERHIVRAYRQRLSRTTEPARDGRLWSELLACKEEDRPALEADTKALEDRLRTKLVKRGGLGYRTPSAALFPTAERFIACVRACGALPAAAWLDGTRGLEREPRKMLGALREKGVQALNIIPDRDWNIPDPAERAQKVEMLGQIIRLAEAFGMPVNIGTEMNKTGQPFADDLDVDALRPHAPVFLKGARIMVGHSRAARYAEFPYVGEAADSEFGPDTSAKNAFFEALGALPPLARSQAESLAQAEPAAAFATLRDAAQNGRWNG